MFRRVFSVFAFAFLTSNAAQAQSFEDVLGRAQGAVGDISKYQQALQNPDLRLQYALVQEMLKLKDPALQRLAKEHALFSTNPVMREAAIKAILDSGATLRIQMAGEEGKYPHTSRWVASSGGTFVQNRGEVLIPVPAAVNDACWGDAQKCIFRQVGSTLQYNPYFNSAPRFILNLGNDGVLRGTASTGSGEDLQTQIDLKE